MRGITFGDPVGENPADQITTEGAGGITFGDPVGEHPADQITTEGARGITFGDPVGENPADQITTSFAALMRYFYFHPVSLRQAWLDRMKIKIPQQAAGVIWSAEKEGFEPPDPW